MCFHVSFHIPLSSSVFIFPLFFKSRLGISSTSYSPPPNQQQQQQQIDDNFMNRSRFMSNCIGDIKLLVNITRNQSWSLNWNYIEALSRCCSFPNSPSLSHLCTQSRSSTVGRNRWPRQIEEDLDCEGICGGGNQWRRKIGEDPSGTSLSNTRWWGGGVSDGEEPMASTDRGGSNGEDPTMEGSGGLSRKSSNDSHNLILLIVF